VPISGDGEADDLSSGWENTIKRDKRESIIRRSHPDRAWREGKDREWKERTAEANNLDRAVIATNGSERRRVLKGRAKTEAKCHSGRRKITQRESVRKREKRRRGGESCWEKSRSLRRQVTGRSARGGSR